MTHDPMCRNAKRIDPHYDTQGRCDCDLIARVRADERERAAERVAALTLNSHYRIECEPPDPVDWSKHVGKCDAIAEVFTAIRGEV